MMSRFLRFGSAAVQKGPPNDALSTLQWAGVFVLLFALIPLFASRAVAQEPPIPDGASVRLVDDGFQFTEGPLWFDGALIFSDIPANTVYRWTPNDGTHVFLRPSGRANGLAVDSNGRLFLAQHSGQVGRWESEGPIEALVETYGGRRLNSPNDLTVASDGTIYFTDPPYGVEEKNRRLSFSGVYRLSPDGELHLLSKRFARPNGVGLSPDESTLYVTDSRETEVWRFDVNEDGGIDNGERFATPKMEGAEGTTDGLTVDTQGNVYTTGPGGVWVYTPDGTKIGRIAVPKAPTNVAFGGRDRGTLFITARAHVYMIELNATGMP